MNKEANDATSKDDAFDYVIVGAGPSAMGILRGLLEEISEGFSRNDCLSPFSIAIVERGQGPPHDEATISPHRWYEAANPNSSSQNVKLFSSEIMGRQMDIPCGIGLGGTSNVNACLCLPPLQQDLESWPEPYRSCIRSNASYLKTIMERHNAIHYASMENMCTPFQQENSLLEFGTRVPTMVEWNKTTAKPVRRNYYDALVKPFLKQHPYLEKYLHWFRGYEAQRLLLTEDTNHVTGVECIFVGNECTSIYRQIYATRRVILCTGAIGTPALLMVSDLGNKESLCGVGQNLQDQALLARVFIKAPSRKVEVASSNGIVALGHLNIPEKDCKGNCAVFQVAITDSVADASIIPSVVAMALRWKFQNIFLMKLVENAFRCVRAFVRLAILCTPLGSILHYMTTTTMIFLMHPLSKGSVTISPKDEESIREPKRLQNMSIQVDPKYLYDPRDMRSLKTAWDALERATHPSSFEIFPRPIFFALSPFKRQWFQIYCHCFLLPYYHYAGTCAMQSGIESEDKTDWVVDTCLKVRGNNGLYICDASVFPSMVSNPPALTCAALGYEFSRMISTELRKKE